MGLRASLSGASQQPGPQSSDVSPSALSRLARPHGLEGRPTWPIYEATWLPAYNHSEGAGWLCPKKVSGTFVLWLARPHYTIGRVPDTFWAKPRRLKACWSPDPRGADERGAGETRPPTIVATRRTAGSYYLRRRTLCCTRAVAPGFPTFPD